MIFGFVSALSFLEEGRLLYFMPFGYLYRMSAAGMIVHIMYVAKL